MIMALDAGELLTTAEAADQLHCTERHVRRLISQGRLTARRYGPRRWRIHPDAVTEYVTEYWGDDAL